MTEKPTEQSKKDASGKPTEQELKEAVKLVNEAIACEEKRLKEIASTQEQSPIQIEGFTSTNHLCQPMVDPRDVACILLRYNFPVWYVLGEDAPIDMWEELGSHYGLDSVCSVNI